MLCGKNLTMKIGYIIDPNLDNMEIIKLFNIEVEKAKKILLESKL